MSDIDNDMEQDIARLKLVAPRVTPQEIDNMMAGVTYDVHVIPGTTTTLATAIAENGFTLAIGMTACADPANFNAEFGAKYAIKDAEGKAKAMLWKLEGWRLKCELAARAALLASLPPVPEGMIAYTGTKQLFARPMTLGEYHDYREWEEIVGRDPDEPGYLVEYIDGGHMNDNRHAGYVSWSPAAVFERTYQPLMERYHHE
ncbi:MAG: Gp49 family protein [Aeromonas veronii]